MPDLRERLNRRAEAFRPALDGLERVHRLAERRHRNRRLLAGVLALVVFAGSAAVLWVAFGAGHGGSRPAATVEDITTVPLPAEPSDIGAGEGGVWVSVPGSVIRLDPTNGQIVATIPVAGTGQLAVGFGSVWVTNFDQDTVTRIDPATNAVQATIPLGPLPWKVAGDDDAFLPFDIAAGEGRVWVDTARGAAVGIDPATNEVGGLTRLDPEGPGPIAAGEGAVWVAQTLQPEEVTRIDPASGRIAGSIETPGQAVAMEAGAGGVWVAAGNSKDDRAFLRIDPHTNEATTIATGVGLGPMAVTSEAVWVADAAGRVTEVDPRTNETSELGRVTGKHISLLVATDDALWATDLDDQTVTRVNRACLASGCRVSVPYVEGSR